MLALEWPAAASLLQEHRLTAVDLPGIQRMATNAGWHGVWDACNKTLLRGRSGGTAVLTRQPCLIFRGPKVHKVTTAIIPWARTAAIHIAGVYGAHSLHHDRTTEHGRMISELQEHLAVLGRVPWIWGGDWNLQPETFQAMWNREGRINHTHTPATCNSEAT